MCPMSLPNRRQKQESCLHLTRRSHGPRSRCTHLVFISVGTVFRMERIDFVFRIVYSRIQMASTTCSSLEGCIGSALTLHCEGRPYSADTRRIHIEYKMKKITPKTAPYYPKNARGTAKAPQTLGYAWTCCFSFLLFPVDSMQYSPRACLFVYRLGSL